MCGPLHLQPQVLAVMGGQALDGGTLAGHLGAHGALCFRPRGRVSRVSLEPLLEEGQDRSREQPWGGVQVTPRGARRPGRGRGRGQSGAWCSRGKGLPGRPLLSGRQAALLLSFRGGSPRHEGHEGGSRKEPPS